MLTQKQHQVFSFITRFTNTKGYAPSYEEIANGIGTRSRGSISKHIDGLIEKGYLEKNPDKIRSLTVIKSDHSEDLEANGIPLVGKIAAGRPIMAFENIDRIDLHQYLAKDARCFLLEVVGESMVGCGIFEGDFVLIQPQSTARNGQIVVALIDGYEATLKRYLQNSNNTISLIPENAEMRPMVFDSHRVTIQGILVAQIRRY